MAEILYLMGFFNTPEIGRMVYDLNNLHVTVLQSFTVDNVNLSLFIEEAEGVTNGYQGVTVTPGEQKMYGENLDFPVLEVEDQTGSLNKLHHKMKDLVFENGGSFNQPSYNGTFYSPHITHGTKDTKIETITHLSIIEHINGFGVDVFNIKNFKLGEK